MLGLGNTIVSGSGLGYVLVNTYTSDFTSGSGSGGNGDVTGADGAVWKSLNITGNLQKDLNATVDGSAGWLKCTFDSDQLGANFGIECDDLDGFTTKVGDYSIISFKTYLDGDWEGTDNVGVRMGISGVTGGMFGDGGALLTPSGSFVFSTSSAIVDLTQDSITNVSGTYSTITTATSSMQFRMNPSVFFGTNFNDAASANAYFAVKDIVVKTYRRT